LLVVVRRDKFIKMKLDHSCTGIATATITAVILTLFVHHCSDLDQTAAAGVYRPVRDSLVTIYETGELESQNSIIISAPSDWHLSYQIIYMPDEGVMVSEGDTVIIFDTKQIELDLEGNQKELERLAESLKEMTLQNELTIQELKTSIANSQIQEEITLSLLEQAQYNSETDRKNAELELTKTRLTLVNQGEALEAQYILNKNSENEIRLKMDQVQGKISQNQRMIDDMYIVAPKNGLVVYFVQRNRNAEKVRVGDSVTPQTPILQIPDLDNMRAIIHLNEVDRPYVEEGIPAEVMVEAYPDTVFSGQVSFVSKIVGYESQYNDLKTYNVYVDIHSPANYRLKPGLSVRVRLMTARLDDVYRVSGWCLFREPNGYYVRTVKNDAVRVELVKLADGQAYVRGELTENLLLVANQELPD